MTDQKQITDTPLPLAPKHTMPHTWLEISKSAIDHNIAHYKNLIGSHNTLAVVIKSNAYGHGLLHIAQICQENSQVDWLCVAQLSEGLTVRNNGITKPILVLGYADTDIIDAVHRAIDFMVDNFEYAQQLNFIGSQHNYRFNVHVKIDTGLSRLGIFPHEALFFIKQLQTLPYIYINGIYSHFAASDNNPDLTHHQLDLFTQTVDELLANTITIPHIHMSNSASITKIKYKPLFNFFRIGLGIYGLSAGGTVLKPALTWKTDIASIKTIPAHSYISYACTYKTTRTTRIALLPIGYSDGYDIRYSNKTMVYINGFYAPVLGRVAMNMMIVDISDCPTAKIGNHVILMGNYPKIGVHDLSQLGDIPNVREILTRINPQAQRIVVE